jgi:cell division protein FtsI/penicillin-binding protein 2
MPRRAIYLLLLLILLLPCNSPAEENLQTFLNTRMRPRQGAVLISNPTTGEILAAWNSRLAFDRAVPPGSTAKLVSAAAALEEVPDQLADPGVGVL